MLPTRASARPVLGTTSATTSGSGWAGPGFPRHCPYTSPLERSRATSGSPDPPHMPAGGCTLNNNSNNDNNNKPATGVLSAPSPSLAQEDT
eukprot:5477178-Pyramimonas_sp.AAC.2